MTLRGLVVATVVFMAMAVPVLAADNHVMLDTDGTLDGVLNACPRPEHNPIGTSNTNNMQRCNGGSLSGKIIGTVSWTVTSAACTAGGGSAQNITNGLTADIDGDGTVETLYGSPQACVWNMAKSDTCEVHAGTYRRSGAYADADALNDSMGGDAGCDKQNCWWATVVAYAYGPNVGTTGYGTAALPGYLRGANMRGVVDTWDTDGDKKPDASPYSPIFSGDRDADGTFDATTCDDTSCTGGDAFYAVQVGCGGGSYDFCAAAHADDVHVDTNADGTFDAQASLGAKNVDYFVIKDIEFRGFNGGHADSGGVRAREGMFGLEGNASTSGIIVDHIYVHDNDFSLSSCFGNEDFWSMFSDSHNGGCTGSTEIRNSLLFQNNEKVLDDDCGVGNECGCPKNFHDNRVVIDITSIRATGNGIDCNLDGTVGNDGRQNVFAYLKSIDTVQSGARKKAHRIWNNEFVYKNAADNDDRGAYFMDLQAFGDSLSHGLGELWVYGNLFRYDPGIGSNKLKRFWNTFCGVGTGAYKFYFFGNTMDFNSDGTGLDISEPCGTTAGTLIVESDNAYFGAKASTLHANTATTTKRRTNNICNFTNTSCTVPTSNNTRAGWFDPGNFATNDPDYYEGLDNYKPKPGGPLVSAGTCDPDGDGTRGVDYSPDGTNDTYWGQLDGRGVDCSAAFAYTPPSGAEPSSCGVASPGGTTTFAMRFGGTVDGFDSTDGLGVAADSSGNMVFVGAFFGNTWDPDGDGTPFSNFSAYDAFAAKYTSAGAYQWVFDYAPTGGGQAYAVAVDTDSSGNVYIAGRFHNSITFGATTLTNPPGGGMNIFLAKLNSSGTALWARGFGDTAMDFPERLTVDASGNVYLAGEFNKTINFGTDPSTEMTANDINPAQFNRTDVFVAKFNTSGVHQWSRSFGSNIADDSGFALAVDSTGNVYVAGDYAGPMDCIGTPLTPVAFNDVFLAKFNSSGTPQYCKSFGGTQVERITELAVDSADDLFATGWMTGPIDFGDGSITVTSGKSAIFLVKWDPTATTVRWKRKIEDAYASHVPTLTVDTNNNVVLADYVRENVDVGGGPLVGTNQPDAFVASYTSAGVHWWSKRYPGTTNSRALGVDADVNGIYVTGYFLGTVNFGTGNLVAGTGNQIHAGYLLKLIP